MVFVVVNGLPGAGKSTIGRVLADQLQVPVSTRTISLTDSSRTRRTRSANDQCSAGGRRRRSSSNHGRLKKLYWSRSGDVPSCRRLREPRRSGSLNCRIRSSCGASARPRLRCDAFSTGVATTVTAMKRGAATNYSNSSNSLRPPRTSPRRPTRSARQLRTVER